MILNPARWVKRRFGGPVFAVLALGGVACGSDGTDGDDGPEPTATAVAASVVPQTLTITDCGGTLPAPGEGETCEVTAGGNGYVRYRGTVLAPNEVLRKGTVLVSPAGIITCVGCSCPQAGSTEVSCPDAVISPGLINTHDHLGNSNNPPMTPTSFRWEHRHQWRPNGIPYPQKITSNSNAAVEVIRAAELRFVMGGATSTAGGASAPGLLRNLDDVNRLEGALVQPTRLDVFPMGSGADDYIASGCGYTPRQTTAEITGFDAYLPHVAEGINTEAHNEFVCASAAGANDIIQAHTAVIHQIATSAADAAALRADRALVSWAPRSNISVYGATAPVTLLHAAGVPIALGSDWIVTGSMNLLRELRCADELNSGYLGGYFSDFQLWQMVTTNAAFAAGVEKGLGMLKPRYVADLAIFDAHTDADHRAVVHADLEDVLLTVRGGKVIYGNADLVDALAPSSCTDPPASICGVNKRACTATDSGRAFLDVQNDVASIYGLVQCGTPLQEPTCVPSRPGEYPLGGGTDADGDGILDASDLCPGVFSPVFPTGGAQADGDADGIGDACDPCPMVAGSCSSPNPDNLDADGWVNGVDNCPDTSSANQSDSDADGKGNACDTGSCGANPGFIPCPTAINVVRNTAAAGHPRPDKPVQVTSLVVTAVRPPAAPTQGFHAQSATVGNYGGVFVNTGAIPPGVQPGQLVTVIGHSQGDDGLGQVGFASVSATGVGIAAVVSATPAQVATGGSLAEKYESKLVNVGNVTVTNVNPDAPADWDEFAVTSNLRVDDELSPTLDNAYPLATPLPALGGVLTHSFGQHKLLALIPVEGVRDSSHPLHPPVGTVVNLRDIHATSRRPSTGSAIGFYAQTASLTPYSGIFVFTSTDTPVLAGNRVNVTGTYGEFNGQAELTSPTVTVIDGTTTLPFGPVVVTPSAIATGGTDAEKYEAMLLRVLGVAVTVMNPDAPSDFDEFQVTGGLRVDDLLHASLDNTYPVGTTFTSLTGVHAFTFSNHKLVPRNAADVVTP